VVTSLLERFDLAESAQKMAATYSGGMRRKLDLAMTLVTRPQIIFLDEPTTGLDPRSRRTMWNIVRELVADGVTVFLTTQYLEEADRLADRIAVLDQGHLVAEGTPDELKRQVPGSHVRLRFSDVVALDGAARVLNGQFRDQLRTVAEADLRIEPILHGSQAQPLEPGDRHVKRGTILQTDALHGRTAPQCEGLAQQPYPPWILVIAAWPTRRSNRTASTASGSTVNR
jgi:ABC-type multidrug transport system ATPase subunit